MKEVTLFSDDAKSRESAHQLGQVSFIKSHYLVQEGVKILELYFRER